MTDVAELLCNEVVRKVEILENEVGIVVSVDCNVGSNDNGNGNVGGYEEDDDGDSFHVFVSGSIELSAGDTGGVSVDDQFLLKSDSPDEIGQLKLEELGVQNEGIVVDPLVLETNGMAHGSTTVTDAEVKDVKDYVNPDNGFLAVDPSVVLAVKANGHLDKISVVERQEDVQSIEVMYDTKEIKVVEAKSDDIGFGLTFVPESIMNTIESSQVTVSELAAAIKPSDVTHEVMANDGLESISHLNGKEKCGVTVDGSGKTSKSLEFQIAVDGSESSGSPIADHEGQATVDGSGKPSEDLGSQDTADEPESCGSPIKKWVCEVPADGSEPSTEKVESNTNVMEFDGKSEEVNGEVEQNDFCSIIKAENKKSEGTEIRSYIESEEHSDSGLVFSEEADAVANARVSPEAQISGTEADGSSEKLLKVTESVEMEVNAEEIKEQVKVEGEIQESQRVVIDVQDDLNLQNYTAESVNEAEVSLETETYIVAVIHEYKSSQNGVRNRIDKPQECNKRKLLVQKDNDSLSNHADSTVVEQKVEIVSHLGTANISAEDRNHGTGIENGDVSNDDDEKETEVKDAEDVPHIVTDIISAEGMDSGTGVENVVVSDDEEKETEVKDAHVECVHQAVEDNRSSEVMDCETGVKNVYFHDEEKESDVNDASVGDHSTLSFSDTIVNPGAVIEFGSIGHHETTLIRDELVEGMYGIQNDEIPNSSIDVEVNDDVDLHNQEVELVKYNFLVKIPRFEDETFRDQIRSAQVLVDEKTRLRDSIRLEVQAKRANMKAYNDEYNAAKMEEIAARRLVRAKRQEIEAAQAVIDRWKNAMSVEDIDARIYGVEHMIQHETLLLKDEKQFIREIKQLKSLRDQLALNMGSPEEIRQAIDMKDHNEERLKTLRKELDSLKAEVSKVEVVLRRVGQKYEEESRKEIELQAQFKAADDVRQKAYVHLNNLKKLSYDKNKNFREFKDDVTKARSFASQKDKKALHHLCANQVETFLEQWNNDDEFRKEYLSRLNTIAIRRQKELLDGAPPVVDDMATLLPSNVNEEVVRNLVPIPGEVEHVSVVLPAEQGKNVSSTELKNVDNGYISKSIENILGQKNQELKIKGIAKLMNSGIDNMAKEEAKLAVVAELAENIPTKEEIELSRKAEEEMSVKLKEQRRLEEKAKAIEALERKKRNAEKAQLRAEVRARKEAEQKEKEREKRLRKKEQKKTDGEEAASSESSNEATTKEIEPVNKKKTQKPPAHFFSKQLKPKPVPPPLLNKNKKRWQQWAKIAFCFLSVFFVILMVNSGLLFNFKAAKFNINF